VRSFALAAALFFCAARAAGAQLPSNEEWRTLHTQHFRVHFTPAVEEEARRAAVNAERAYAELSTELVPPRGTIDLVISDNVDYVNGYATPFPSNRIVVFAHPPTDASGLRDYDDWNALVVTHELTHIFHLDRTRGIWRFGQAIFGRNPLLFPNLYEPRWVVEGLAVYFESRMTGVGRLESSEHSMTARAAALANRLPTLQELSPGTSRFPGGNVVYIYGSLLFDYLSRTRGPGSIRDFVERRPGDPAGVTYGDLVAIVDYVTEPFAVLHRRGIRDGSETDICQLLAMDVATDRGFLRMLHASHGDVNHFQDGGLVSFEYWHKTAILLAGDRGKGDADLLLALIFNSYADHPLQDFFAPGHALTPRRDLHDASAMALHDLFHRHPHVFEINLAALDALEVFFEDKAIFARLKLDGVLDLYGDGRLWRNPEQAEFVAAVQARSIADVLLHCLEKRKDQWTQVDKNRVARCLRSRGWIRFKARAGDDREWRYQNPEWAQQ